MSTTPSSSPSPPDEGPTTSRAGPGYGGMDLARLPIPGNAELVVWLLVLILFAIIWAASDDVNADLFVTVTAVVTFAYLVSRGIAKASRVLEH